MGASEWHASDQAATLLEGGTPRHDMVELADGVWIPRTFTASYVSPDKTLKVRIGIDVNASGHPVVRSLEAASVEDDQRGIDRDRLRGIPTGELLQRACHERAQVIEDGTRSVTVGGGPEVSRRLATRRGRISHEELVAVADIYREHDGPSPTRAVATRLDITYDQAAKRVQRARRDGLLSATEAGKATNQQEDDQ